MWEIDMVNLLDVIPQVIMIIVMIMNLMIIIISWGKPRGNFGWCNVFDIFIFVAILLCGGFFDVLR
jgi:hypothetical protein